MPIDLPGGVLESEITRSYNSFSGTDIHAVIGNRKFQELQAVSYSITREKAPVYCMGDPNPKAYARNKRGIAGSLIWINFDRHALLSVFWDAGGQFVADVDEIRPDFVDVTLSTTAVFTSSLTTGSGLDIGTPITITDSIPVSDLASMKQLAMPWYSDQILPFDITIAAASEYGAMATSKIFGVEILNEGAGTSVDDTVLENNATFVAREVEPMQAVDSPYTGGIGGSNLSN